MPTPRLTRRSSLRPASTSEFWRAECSGAPNGRIEDVFRVSAALVPHVSSLETHVLESLDSVAADPRGVWWRHGGALASFGAMGLVLAGIGEGGRDCECGQIYWYLAARVLLVYAGLSSGVLAAVWRRRHAVVVVHLAGAVVLAGAVGLLATWLP